jgi:hypothetical protein
MSRMHNPPHPGETLREDILPALGLNVTQAAKQLGVTRAALITRVEWPCSDLSGNGVAIRGLAWSAARRACRCVGGAAGRVRPVASPQGWCAKSATCRLWSKHKSRSANETTYENTTDRESANRVADEADHYRLFS